MERAIYCIEKTTQISNLKRKEILDGVNKLSLLTIPFEKFVIDPWPYLSEIEKRLNTSAVNKTSKVMKIQKVPRKVISDGPAFEIYQRCGWEPSSEGSEENELTKRRRLVARDSSSDALAVMDRLSKEYFNDYLS